MLLKRSQGLFQASAGWEAGKPEGWKAKKLLGHCSFGPPGLSAFSIFIATVLQLNTIDEDLLQYDEIWAAAGTPRAAFKLTPRELQKITGGQVVSVK